MAQLPPPRSPSLSIRQSKQTQKLLAAAVFNGGLGVAGEGESSSMGSHIFFQVPKALAARGLRTTQVPPGSLSICPQPPGSGLGELPMHMPGRKKEVTAKGTAGSSRHRRRGACLVEGTVEGWQGTGSGSQGAWPQVCRPPSQGQCLLPIKWGLTEVWQSAFCSASTGGLPTHRRGVGVRVRVCTLAWHSCYKEPLRPRALPSPTHSAALRGRWL